MAPNALRFDNPGPGAALALVEGGRGARSTAGHPAPRYDEHNWSSSVTEAELSGFKQALASLDKAIKDRALRNSHAYKARVMRDRKELLEWYENSSGSGIRPPKLTAGAPDHQNQQSPEVRAVREKLDACLHALHAQAVMFYHAKAPNSGAEQAADARERHASRQRFSFVNHPPSAHKRYVKLKKIRFCEAGVSFSWLHAWWKL